MFDNVIAQNVTKLIASDVCKGMFPNSVLFSGPKYSGKLTTALELSRILSCKGEGKIIGKWDCNCSSCMRHRNLVSSELLISGHKDCCLEIAASKKAFLSSLYENKPSKDATNILFIRSVRKLTSRFNPVFYEGDSKASKISPYISSIEELLEELEPKNLPEDFAAVEKKSNSLMSECEKLEANFMYDSIPISHIRNASNWARFSSISGKKFYIIENAERMNESSRNCLLKILEEPPKDTVFILTTNRKGAVMPTILSRVRNYGFAERNAEQQSQVIDRIFRGNGGNINDFLTGFLPIDRNEIISLSNEFLDGLNHGSIINYDELVKKANDFKPRLILEIFLNNLLMKGGQRIRFEVPDRMSIAYSEKQHILLEKINRCYENITIFNQSPASGLEKLAGELM